MRTFEQKWNDEKFEKKLWRRLPYDIKRDYWEYIFDADIKEIRRKIRNHDLYKRLLEGLKEDWMPLINGKYLHTPICLLTTEMVNHIRKGIKDNPICWEGIKKDDTISDIQTRAYGKLIKDCLWKDMGLGAELHWDDGLWLTKLEKTDITAEEAERMSPDDLHPDPEDY